MIKSYIIGATAALALTATAASAATLSFNGDGVSVDGFVVTNNDVDDYTAGDYSFNGTEISYIDGAQKDSDNGLSVSGPAYVTYTYLGFEAGNDNYAAEIDGVSFFVNDTGATSYQNDGTVAPVQFTQMVDGLLNFAFGTTAPCCAFIANNGGANPDSANYAIGYQRISDHSYYVLFDDIAGNDRDFDDMVMRIDVAAIPLPAGAVLLLSALFGAGALRRRQKTA